MNVLDRIPLVDLLSVCIALVLSGLVLTVIFGIIALRYAGSLCWRYGILC